MDERSSGEAGGPDDETRSSPDLPDRSPPGAAAVDEVDRRILRALDDDARNNTNAAISDRVGVSASTVGNRIAALEERGIVTGYRTELDYGALELPLRVLFVCTAPITDRARMVEGVIDLPSVVSVRELMTGESNVHVEVVAATDEAVSAIARRIDELGLSVTEEILVKREYRRPSSAV